jgi:rubredoxin
MILTNYWKIYKSLYSPFLSSNNIRLRNIHREFLKVLVELLFCYDSETYTKTVSGTTFKEYPKYSYTPHKSSPKSQFPESISQSLIDISRKTPFIFKGDFGRPRMSIPAKITPISQHQYIKIITRGFCLIYRNSEEIQNS